MATPRIADAARGVRARCAQLDAAAPGRADARLAVLHATTSRRTRRRCSRSAHQRWPAVAWVGAVGVGICASGVEYFDEPALALMLRRPAARRLQAVLRRARRCRAIELRAHTALVHADPATPDLAELIGELSDRTATGYLFGGLASARTRTLTIADGVFEGGLSGVAFADEVGIVSRVTQGCQPVGPARRIDAADGNVVITLDGRPALDVLLDDLGLAERMPARRAAAAARHAGRPRRRRRRCGARGGPRRRRRCVRRRRARAPPDRARPGAPGHRHRRHRRRRHAAAFCARDTEAARRDLTRICTEMREAIRAVPTTSAASAAPHIAGARLCQLRRARRPAFRRAVGRARDRAARARRRAAGRLLRRRRDRAPPPVRLHRRADGVQR